VANYFFSKLKKLHRIAPFSKTLFLQTQFPDQKQIFSKYLKNQQNHFYNFKLPNYEKPTI